MSDPILYVFCDGACNPNPGPSGYGVYAVKDIGLGGEEVARISGRLGPGTNNSAEYMAVMAGLELAISLGYKRVQIFSDSRLVMNHIRGDWRAKNEALRPLLGRLRDLLARFEHWEVSWIPREKNKIADELSKQALNGTEASQVQVPPVQEGV